jgi:hypothetical protein
MRAFFFPVTLDIQARGKKKKKGKYLRQINIIDFKQFREQYKSCACRHARTRNLATAAPSSSISRSPRASRAASPEFCAIRIDSISPRSLEHSARRFATAAASDARSRWCAASEARSERTSARSARSDASREATSAASTDRSRDAPASRLTKAVESRFYSMFKIFIINEHLKKGGW